MVLLCTVLINYSDTLTNIGLVLTICLEPVQVTLAHLAKSVFS